MEAGGRSGPGGWGRQKKEVEQLDAAAATLIVQTLKIFAQAEAGACDLPQVEIRMREAARSFAAHMVGAALCGPLQRAAGVDVPAHRRELRTTGILSAVGEVSYTRWYTVDAEGNRGFPADEALGIVGGCTPGAAKRLCHMGAKSQSYQEASKALELLAGIQASPNTIQRLISLVGPDMAAWAQKRAPATVPPQRDVAVCLQMDMTGVRLLKKYLDAVKGKDGPPKGRQIKCGVVFLLERGSDGRYHKIPDSSVHILSFGDVTDFSAQLNKAREKLGAGPVARLIVISDGAEWIWNIVADRFREAFAVVDFWHAAEHLNELCQFAYGKAAATGKIFARLRHNLKRYGVNGLIRHFESLDVSKSKRRAINKRLRYFRTHQKRMQYHLYRRAGWPIGSGEVEGACKSLIKQRTDLSGQRWSLDGALNVLWVRALVNDGLHDRYWNAHSHRSANKQAA
jgi:hypothetical protein